jgi:hypothetical protein
MAEEKRFKLWVTIEEQTQTEDDTTYEDADAETVSVGTFDNIEDAREHLQLLTDRYMDSGNAEGF